MKCCVALLVSLVAEPTTYLILVLLFHLVRLLLRPLSLFLFCFFLLRLLFGLLFFLSFPLRFTLRDQSIDDQTDHADQWLLCGRVTAELALAATLTLEPDQRFSCCRLGLIALDCT